MKKTMKKLWLALAAAVSCVGAAVAADIQYVADNGGGEYSGAGYGISVSVSAPATGAVVKYSESETGPWQDEPITYKDVCNATPIYFKISAEGYSTAIDSRTVTITPKTLTSDFVWLVLPTEDYVYDGGAKTPDAACGDGAPSIITENDFDVSYSGNINAGTSKATFTGKGNYTGTVEEDFEIQKANNEWTTEPAMPGWTYGQAASEPTSVASNGVAVVTYGTSGNPGSLGTTRPTLPGGYVATFTVAESQNYKALTKDVDFAIAAATLQYVADDVSGTYSGAGYGIAATISVSAPASGATIKYAESETGPWQDAPITYSDVCNAKPIFFRISATGYATVTDSRTVTVTPKTLTSDFVWLVLPTEDYVYDGTGKTPDAACGDGAPSIIAPNDFDVSYSDNVNAGTAKATFTGKGNYTGTVEEEFKIKKADYGDLSDVQWNYAGEFAYDGTEKTVSVVGTLPSGVSVASYTGNKATLPGTYTAHVVFGYDTTNYNEPVFDDLSWKIKSAEESKLHEIFDEPPAIVTPDGDGWKVTLTGDMTGPIDIPDNLGHVTIDLNGFKITGPDGSEGSETAPGGDGVPAIRIVPSGSDDGSVTRLSLITGGGDSLVKGGDGGDGNPGGNGAPAITVLEGTRYGVLIDVGARVTVQGGVGGKGLGGGAGDDGVPIDGGIGVVQGVLIRARVMPPEIASKEYTGFAQTAEVTASPLWRTAFNEGGTAVATYVVALELTDAVRYRWPDIEGSTLYLSFEITKATIDISAVGWNYFEPLPYTAYPQEVVLTNLPAGVTATYTGNKATETGTYTAHATLNYNTDNFVVAAVPDCVWTIKPAVPIDGGNTDSLGGSTINYSGTYDGEAHGISVILRDPRPAGACVRYSRSKNGPYTDENPLFTDVCRETVWYLVTADHYEALTNSATVTIAPKPFTSGLVKQKGLKEVVEDGVSKIVPAFVIEDSWPCKVEGRDWELVDWTPRTAGGGTAVLSGRNNYTGQVTVEIGNEMTVLFDAVYGADRESLRMFTTQEPGKPYVFPTAPSYHGHAFLGWFTAKVGGEQVTPGTIVSLADTDTLYAHWTVKTFRVSYELNGGIGDVEDFDAEYGSAFGAMPLPKKSGYIFDGWWTTVDFQRWTKVSEGDGVPFRDVTLFAKWERRRLWYTDATFHLEGAATYDGYVVDPAAGDLVAGTIQVKAGRPNKRTGVSKLMVTVQLAGGKKSKFRGSTFDGSLTGTVGGRALVLKLGYSSLSGTLGGYALDGARNVFAAKDADSKFLAAQALKRWQGTYVAAWKGASGWNGLSLDVKAKGKVKVSGTLADGAKVSAKSQLLVGERECALAVSWTKKDASVACLVWFCEDGTVECMNADGAETLIANARAGATLPSGAAFRIDAAAMSAVVPGLQAELLPDGVAVRMKGAKFDIDKAGKVSAKGGVLDISKAGTNPAGLKLSYKMKGCTFKGAFSAYVLSGGTLKKVKVQVSGVVLGGKGYGTATVRKAGSVPISIE